MPRPKVYTRDLAIMLHVRITKGLHAKIERRAKRRDTDVSTEARAALEFVFR